MLVRFQLPEQYVMKFRYDFFEALDLTRFQKQAPHYIKGGQDTTFDLYVFDYRISAQVVRAGKAEENLVELKFDELKRDKDGEITHAQTIFPLTDIRFKEIKFIQELFEPTKNKLSLAYKTSFTSFKYQDTVDKLCEFVKLLHKINSLLAFI